MLRLRFMPPRQQAFYRRSSAKDSIPAEHHTRRLRRADPGQQGPLLGRRWDRRDLMLDQSGRFVGHSELARFFFLAFHQDKTGQDTECFMVLERDLSSYFRDAIKDRSRRTQ